MARHGGARRGKARKGGGRKLSLYRPPHAGAHTSLIARAVHLIEAHADAIRLRGLRRWPPLHHLTAELDQIQA